MFLMKAIQEQYLRMPMDGEESVAFVIFNVKGKDLMAIHSPNDFKDDNEGEKEKVYQEYNDLGLNTEPFKKVKYFIPYSSNSSAKQSTYLPKEDIEEYIREGQLQKFKYSYEAVSYTHLADSLFHPSPFSLRPLIYICSHHSRKYSRHRGKSIPDLGLCFWAAFGNDIAVSGVFKME